MRIVIAILAAAALAGSLSAFQGASTRPQQLPPHHPPLNPNQAPAPAADPADAADVASISAIVDAYYDAISGPPGAERAWGRFQSLFLPGTRMYSVTSGPGGGPPIVVTPQLFAQVNKDYFRGIGYVERGVRQEVDTLGHIAHVLSTYEASKGADPHPYTRGLNSFQLIQSEGRWWIVSVAWERERDNITLPNEYLPKTGEGQ